MKKNKFELEPQVSKNSCFVLMIHRLKNLQKKWSTDFSDVLYKHVRNTGPQGLK